MSVVAALLFIVKRFWEHSTMMPALEIDKSKKEEKTYPGLAARLSECVHNEGEEK